ncbi:MAG TPA: hypothetical protein VND65_17450, partial [Candidatus Binatia bacterium]|nr:hypothetical protein [Candidatus Binatia bacterium]
MTKSLFRIRFLAAFWFFATAAVAQSTAPAQSPAVRAIGKKLQQHGVRNFGEVTPSLYRGGLTTTDGLQALHKLGVNVIVDTHANDSPEKAEAEK